MKKKLVRKPIKRTTSRHSRSSAKLSFRFITIFSLCAILAGALLYRALLPPQSLDVFQLEPALTYGNTTISGRVELASDDSGIFLLKTPPADLAIELDVKGLEAFLDQQVSASGYLTLDEFGNHIMTVSSLETI